ncbi:hypothetical protein C7C46_01645 [Streptomyces tateyamensis]|uniref:HEAT repeat domain-containing protein n=1 Tax=Streptomyces tateyamensis TaxID=565073 RepID=A0A2V4PP68_9ACTN|nr:hypothetical protein [Streptomyces tateyamensis]PYC88093.1 hypothetical protein C7C46_01645 [Streptomyces tateyamensis]
MNDESEDEWAYAPIGTLEGLLQRGRGLGALSAQGDPTADRLVYDCVRRDCRWDSQVDDRHLYLARLIRDLELSPAPVISLLAGDEDDCERATGVLELLARSGSVEARQVLRSYIREGEHWVDVLESVAGCWPVEWWDDLADAARSRLTGDEPLLWRCEPWVRWQLRPRNAAPSGKRPVADAEAGLSGRELLDVLADPGAADSARAGALWALAERPAESALIPLVPSLVTADGRRPLPVLSRAVRRLGALAVPAAREWATDARPWLSWAGKMVLAEHGETRDLPVLIGELVAHWKARDWCGPERLAAGLARFGPQAAEAAPLLRRLWLRTPHSYERPAYLKALAAIDPAGLEHAYVESLWDCESDARLLGIASAPDVPLVRERLVQLRDDPMEEPEVRSAAGAR